MKIFIPLKFKVFFLMLIVPTIMIFSYFMLLQFIIIPEKKMEVFNYGLLNLNNFSEQIENEVNFAKRFSNIFIKKTLLKRKGALDTSKKLVDNKKIFDSQDQVNSISLYVRTETSDKIKNVFTLKKDTFLLAEELYISDLSKLAHHEEHLKVLERNSTVFSFSSIDDEDGKEYLVAIAIKSEFIKKVFKLSKIYSNFMVNQSGMIKFSSNSGKNNQQLISSIMKKQSDFLHEGSFIHQAEHEKFLVSYIKFDQKNYLLSTISYKNAFANLIFLKNISIAYIIALVSFATILMLVFANQISYGLRVLYNYSKMVAEGNYDSTVKVKSWDEVGELAGSFNNMTLKIKNYIKELKHYSQGLEVLVDEKTKDLNKAMALQKAMMDSLPQGFFIMDAKGVALGVYSKEAEKIFSTVPTGNKLGTLLNLPADEVDEFQQFCIDMAEESLPFDDMAALAPHFVLLKDRHIDIDYAAIRNKENKISGIVLIASDKTDEKEALERSLIAKAKVDMILKIIKNKRAFLTFISRAETIILQINEFVNLENISPEQLDEFYRSLHTLKGNASMFHLLKIQNVCHNLEDRVSSMIKKSQSELDKEYFSTQFDEINDLFTDLFSEVGAIAGLDSFSDVKEVIEVEQSKLIEYYQSFKSETQNQVLVKSYYDEVCCLRVADLLYPFKEIVEELSDTTNKKMYPLSIIDNGERIFPGDIKDILESLIHIFRNSIDHGIENEATRIELNKDPVGKIIIKIESKEIDDSKKLITILIKDDGSGIDPQKIKNKMIELGREKDIEGKADTSIYRLIFDAGFSTAKNVSNLSGRGVGLSALQHDVESIGGSIDVYSELGQGLIFKIDIPVNY